MLSSSGTEMLIVFGLVGMIKAGQLKIRPTRDFRMAVGDFKYDRELQ